MTFFIIVPCYNEQEVLPATHAVLTAMLRRLKNEGKVDEGRVLYVDDGSRDTTWSIICRLSEESPMVEGLKLAHNVGHQQALWAGLEWAAAHADAAVSIDADLQDDVEVIPQMVDYYLKGIDVVFGVRRERKTDTWFKRTTALAFYALMRMMNTGVVYNHADFRLMSRRAMQALVTYPERNLSCAVWCRPWDSQRRWYTMTARNVRRGNRSIRFAVCWVLRWTVSRRSVCARCS